MIFHITLIFIRHILELHDCISTLAEDSKIKQLRQGVMLFDDPATLCNYEDQLLNIYIFVN